MLVKELIKILQGLDQDKKITIAQDLLYHDDIFVIDYPKEFLREWEDGFYYLDSALWEVESND